MAGGGANSVSKVITGAGKSGTSSFDDVAGYDEEPGERLSEAGRSGARCPDRATRRLKALSGLLLRPRAHGVAPFARYARLCRRGPSVAARQASVCVVVIVAPLLLVQRTMATSARSVKYKRVLRIDREGPAPR